MNKHPMTLHLSRRSCTALSLIGCSHNFCHSSVTLLWHCMILRRRRARAAEGDSDISFCRCPPIARNSFKGVIYPLTVIEVHADIMQDYVEYGVCAMNYRTRAEKGVPKDERVGGSREKLGIDGFFFCLIINYSHATYLDHGDIMYSPRGGGTLQAPFCPQPSPVPRK